MKLCYDIYGSVSVHRSALKHGLTASQVLDAWVQAGELECWLDDADPRRLLRIGFDSRSGAPVELVGLVFDESRVLVIYAMRARAHIVELVERSKS